MDNVLDTLFKKKEGGRGLPYCKFSRKQGIIEVLLE